MSFPTYEKIIQSIMKETGAPRWRAEYVVYCTYGYTGQIADNNTKKSDVEYKEHMCVFSTHH